MLYSSSFDALKKSLVGVHKYIQVSRHETTQLLLNTVDGWTTMDYFQATDASEASEEAVEKQLRSTDRVWSWPPFLIFYAAPDRGSVGILLDRSIY